MLFLNFLYINSKIQWKFIVLKMVLKQLKSLETTLAGALRREQMEETSIKKLEAEIEQLNRLVVLYKWCRGVSLSS